MTGTTQTDLRFRLLDFEAWAPGLECRADWIRWASAPTPVALDGQPALLELPPLQRRRVERLGRMAIHTTWRVDPVPGSAAYVFASPLGEIGRSVELLGSISAGAIPSPSTFASSVHNAIGAMYSIARGVTRPLVATAGGKATVETAFVEAFCALSDGDDQVIVTVYDEPMPPVYAAHSRGASFPFSWSCRLARPDPGDPGDFQLRLPHGTEAPLPGAKRAARPSVDIDIPHPVEIARFLLGAIPEVSLDEWVWTRDV